jgi:uncharacterized membrane protein HdeD (DUF308 family)
MNAVRLDNDHKETRRTFLSGFAFHQGHATPPAPQSAASSAALARNWWAVGLRGIAAVIFIIAVLVLPRPTLGALLMWFATYVAADGILAMVAGVRAMRRGERWQMLMYEGTINLVLAGAVLIWPAMAALAFVQWTTVWAILTGTLLIAAARRLSVSHGRWLLVLAGSISCIWGVLAATVGPSSGGTPESVGWWLVGYALPFAVTLLVLSGLLQRRHAQSAPDAGSS